MITEYAKELAEKAKNTDSITAAQEYSKLLHEELIANCHPTKQEFVSLLSRVVLMPQMLWDYVLMIPLWSGEIDNLKDSMKLR